MIIDDTPPADKGKRVEFEGVMYERVPLSMVRDVRRIQPIDLRVWCVLLHDARFRGHCEYTDGDLAGMLGVSPQTIRRSLLRLARAGYIEREGAPRRRILLEPIGDGAGMPTLRIRSRRA